MKKTHKRKKATRYHGRKMGTCGTGARKKSRDSGHRGGKGMSGSGKRADHKKTLITKKFGNSYFGKKGFTSTGIKKDKKNKINLKDISEKYDAKNEIDLSDYKILGEGELNKKLIIKAKEASKTAIKKVEVAGGKIILSGKKEEKEIKETKEE